MDITNLNIEAEIIWRYKTTNGDPLCSYILEFSPSKKYVHLGSKLNHHNPGSIGRLPAGWVESERVEVLEVLKTGKHE